MNEPNPLPHFRIINPDTVDDYRRVNCGNYNNCLKRAERQKWEGFHCNECKAFTLNPPSSDYEGATKLLTELDNIVPFKASDEEVIDKLQQLGDKDYDPSDFSKKVAQC